MLKKLIPGSQGIYVTSSCEFYCGDSEECDLQMIDNFVIIDLYDQTCKIDKTWLMLLAMFEIQDRDAIQNVRFIKLAYSKRQVPWRAIYKSPRYFDKDQLYRKVPGYPKIAVSKHGECVSTVSSKILNQNIDHQGYYRVSTYDPLVQKYRHISVHILVATTWLAETLNIPNIVVNHLDGIKINNYYKNLEWTTFLGNTTHAINTGLRNDCCPCRLRDIESEEILEFPSIQETLKFLGYKDTSQDSKLFGSTFVNKLYNEKYELRVGDDDRPWFYTKDKQIMSTTSSYNIVTILDNGIVKVFHGTKDLIPYYQIWNSGGGLDTVLAKLKILRPDVEILEVIKPDIVKSIQVKCTSTGIVTEYPSIRSAERDLKFPKTMITLTVRHNGTKEYKGYVMRYKSNDPWPDIQDHKFHPVKIEVTDLETQEVTEYPSLKAVARSLGICRSQIKRILRNARIGDRWKMKTV